tara:strand:- start:500 stop:1432 length:933 start_codon:yes stop_codon:yes gene_type:complete
MKIIITGGMGFVGTKLIEKLGYDLHEIVVIDNFSTNISGLIEDVQIINLDLLKDDDFYAFDLGKADLMIHLAGPSSGPASSNDPLGTINRSNKITYNVLKLCDLWCVKNLVFASSMAVYGDPVKNPVDELTNCNPISFYGIAKLTSEHIIQAFCKTSKLEYNILRFFNIYGPGQDLQRMDQGLASIYLSMLLNQKPFIIKGKVNRVRDLIHIDDVVNSIIFIINNSKKKNQVVNICTGEPITVEKLAKILITHFDNYSWDNVIEEDGMPGDIQQIYGNNEKLVNDIGYKPKFNIQKGIEDFVYWAKQSNN